MINLTATIDREEFNQTIRELPDDVAEQIAKAFPRVFSPCFVYPGEDFGAASPPAAKPPKRSTPPADARPRERKPRAAKDPTDDEIADRAEVMLFMRQPAKNGSRPADICPGMDKKRKSKALVSLKEAGMLVLQGTAGAARYYLPNGAGQEAEA